MVVGWFLGGCLGVLCTYFVVDRWLHLVPRWLLDSCYVVDALLLGGC